MFSFFQKSKPSVILDMTQEDIKKFFSNGLKTYIDESGMHGWSNIKFVNNTLRILESSLLDMRSGERRLADPDTIDEQKKISEAAFFKSHHDKIITDKAGLQTAMASSLIEELRLITGKGHDELLEIVQEKLALVHKNFSEVIRSMGLEESLDTPEKAKKFILMTPESFPKSWTLTGINISNSSHLFRVFTYLRGAVPASSPLLFADAAIAAGAGAGSAARPGSASGSSTEDSRTPSPI